MAFSKNSSVQIDLVKAKHPTVEDVLADQALLSLLEDFIKKYQLHNMVCERMLGADRKAAELPFQRTTCKRVAALGLLDDILRRHHTAGGKDPIIRSRSDVREFALETVASAARHKQSNVLDKRPSSWEYVRAMESQRKHRLPRRQFLAERKRFVQEFKNLLPEEQAHYAWAQNRAAVEDKVDANTIYGESIGQDLWGASNHKHPIKPEVVERHQRQKARSQASEHEVLDQSSFHHNCFLRCALSKSHALVRLCI